MNYHFVLSYLFMYPYWIFASLKKIHFVIIGVPACTIIFLVTLFFNTTCLFINCETEIEITTFETPELVNLGDKMQAKFTIKNKGEVTAENCKLSWSQKGARDTVSKTFQLSPSEEIRIELLSVEGAPAPRGVNPTLELMFDPEYQIVSRSWVTCDNTESTKVQSDINVIIP